MKNSVLVGALVLGSFHVWGQDTESARLTFSGDIRGRVESGAFLNRVRLGAAVNATPWLRFEFQGQDAQAFAPGDPAAREAQTNFADIRQAFVSIGRAEGWSARVGRQELAFGDERLIGSDNYWCNLARSFDAALVSYANKDTRLDWFHSWVVQPRFSQPDRPSREHRLSGFHASFGSEEAGRRVEPFVYFKNASSSIVTSGIRTLVSLPRRFEFQMEMAFQTGKAGDYGVKAWAGAWELGYQFRDAEGSPSVAVSYNLGSGDSNPNDRTIGTFDDLYPAGFNGCGITDPFAWRNIRYVAETAEWPLSRRWTLSVENHSYWLDTRADGLYVDDGPAFDYRPDAAAYVGDQLNVGVVGRVGRNFELTFGFARLFRGAYLKDGGHSSSNTAYASWRWAF